MWQPLPDESVTRDGHPFVVYYLHGAADVLLYIGRTNDVNQRFKAHSVMPWWPLVARHSFEFHKTYAEAYNAERREILERLPLLNRQRFEPVENPPAPPRQPEPRPKTPGPTYVKTAEAARALGIHRTTLARWVRRYRLEPAAETLGGNYQWDLEALRRQLSAVDEYRRG